MINYSIVMRSVNANLLEINQAKSRINQAKQEGKNPEQKDLDLVKTEKQNAFAISQYTLAFLRLLPPRSAFRAACKTCKTCKSCKSCNLLPLHLIIYIGGAVFISFRARK